MVSPSKTELVDNVNAYWEKKRRLDALTKEGKRLGKAYQEEGQSEIVRDRIEASSVEIRELLADMFNLAKKIGHIDPEVFHLEYGLRMRAVERYQSDLEVAAQGGLATQEQILQRIQGIQDEMTELKQAVLRAVAQTGH